MIRRGRKSKVATTEKGSVKEDIMQSFIPLPHFSSLSFRGANCVLVFLWAHTADSHIFAKKKTSFLEGYFRTDLSPPPPPLLLFKLRGRLCLSRVWKEEGEGEEELENFFQRLLEKPLLFHFCGQIPYYYCTTTPSFPYGFWKRRREKVFFLFSVISPPSPPPLPFLPPPPWDANSHSQALILLRPTVSRLLPLLLSFIFPTFFFFRWGENRCGRRKFRWKKRRLFLFPKKNGVCSFFSTNREQNRSLKLALAPSRVWRLTDPFLSLPRKKDRQKSFFPEPTPAFPEEWSRKRLRGQKRKRRNSVRRFISFLM